MATIAKKALTVFSFISIFPPLRVHSRNLSYAMTATHSFVEDFKFAVNDYIGVSKYVSSKSGMVAVIADVPGPIVDGYLVLATEAHDDDGLPHTLEHLVFMGSEDYPYKGF